MADFRALALQAILADSKIDDAEVKLIKKALYADGKIDKDEFDFLIELRSGALRKGKEVSPAFEKLYADSVYAYLVVDGKLAAEGVVLLEKLIVKDKKIVPAEKKKFLEKVKKGAALSDQLDKLLAKVEKELTV